MIFAIDFMSMEIYNLDTIIDNRGEKMRKKKDFYYSAIRYYPCPLPKKDTAEDQYAIIIKNAIEYFSSLSQFQTAEFLDLPRLLKQILNLKEETSCCAVINKLEASQMNDSFMDMRQYFLQHKDKIIDGIFVKSENEYNQIKHRLQIILDNLEECQK